MKLFRLASLSHTIFDGTGAALHGARWNSKGLPVIYAAASLAGARLELLAHIGFEAKPKNFGYVEIDVPDEIAVMRFPRKTVPSDSTSVAWGDAWLKERKTLLARVPSKASPGDFNYLINPSHPDFRKLHVSAERRVRWDSRHFRNH